MSIVAVVVVVAVVKTEKENFQIDYVFLIFWKIIVF